MRRRFQAPLLVLLAALAISGCITPSIPIPPPEPTSMTFEIDTDLGEAIFSYDDEPNYADAIVYIYNRDLGVGIITTANSNGGVGPTVPFPAEAGNEIAVTFETVEQIVSTCVKLRSGSTDVDLCD